MPYSYRYVKFHIWNPLGEVGYMFEQAVENRPLLLRTAVARFIAPTDADDVFAAMYEQVSPALRWRWRSQLIVGAARRSPRCILPATKSLVAAAGLYWRESAAQRVRLYPTNSLTIW